MTVEAGLADQELDAAPEPVRDRFDGCPDGLELSPVACDGGLRNAGRSAVLTEDLAQRRAPLAGRDAGLGGGDRRLHDIAALPGGPFDLGKSGGGFFGVAVFAPSLQFADLLGFHR